LVLNQASPSRTVADAWAKYNIKFWTGAGAGQVYDRTLITGFTGEDGEEIGGYPVNFSKLGKI